MIDPRFYEVHMNKLILVRRFLILFVFILIMSVFIIAYLSFNKEIKEGYAIFHGFFAFVISYLLGVIMVSISTEIDSVRNDFYSAIKERNLTFDEYQQQKKERK